MPPSPLQRRVETEYGKPFVEVVKHLAASGLTMQAAAKLLGYKNRHNFRLLCTRKGWRKWFHTPPPPKAWDIEFEGFRGSFRAHCRRVGVSRHLATKRWRERPGNMFYAMYGIDKPAWAANDENTEYRWYWVGCAAGLIAERQALARSAEGHETTTKTHPNAA